MPLVLAWAAAAALLISVPLAPQPNRLSDDIAATTLVHLRGWRRKFLETLLKKKGSSDTCRRFDRATRKATLPTPNRQPPPIGVEGMLRRKMLEFTAAAGIPRRGSGRLPRNE